MTHKKETTPFTDEIFLKYRVEIGKQLKIARKVKNISQTKLGEIMGVTFQQAQKYENGSNRISAEMLAYLSITLDVPISYFFETSGINIEEKEIVDGDAVNFLNHFSRLKKERKKLVIDIIRILERNK